MMADLSMRTALRMSLGGPAPRPSAELLNLVTAGRPKQAWRPARWTAIAAMIVASVLLSTGGDAWRFAGQVGEPTYLDDAVQSREVSLVRTAMASRPHVPWMKPNDISTAIRIRLPVMPTGWRLTDVQVFPSDEGPSAQLLIDPGDGRQLSLFSSRINGAVTRQPVVIDRLGETMAFWEVSGQSFVLMGEGSRAELHEMALDLADNHLL